MKLSKEDIWRERCEGVSAWDSVTKGVNSSRRE